MNKKHYFVKIGIAALVGIFAIGIFMTRQNKNWQPDKKLAKYTFEEKEEKGKRRDQPDKAFEHDQMMTRDPKTGRVPHERLLKAYQQTIQMQKAQKNNPDIKWVERGPNNVGGRTRTLMFDPNDGVNGYRKLWAGSVGGGLWVNNDINNPHSRWQPVNDLMPNLSVCTMAYDPSNPSTYYIGTGEGWYNGDAIRGMGVWKSEDAGATWTNLTSTNNMDNFIAINKIGVTPKGTILAAVRGKDNTGGIYRSSNGGTTWQLVGETAMQKPGADIEIAKNGKIYASTGYNLTQGDLWTSEDDGLTWIKRTPTSDKSFSRIEIAVAQSDVTGNTAYIVGNNNTDNIEFIKYTTNGGKSWTTQKKPADSNADDIRQLWYDLILWVSPTNPNIITLGIVDLYNSLDGGKTWRAISDWRPQGLPYVHADQHAMTNRPGAGNNLFFGNDGGIFECKNITDTKPTFVSINRNYNVTQFYSCAIENKPTSGYIIAGAQDNGTIALNDVALNNGVEVAGGDGAFCFIDQENPKIQFLSVVNNAWYYTIDGWESYIDLKAPTSWAFISPADYDSKKKVLCTAGAAGKYVYVSNILDTVPTITECNLINNSRASALKLSPYTPKLVFIGSEASGLYKIENADQVTPTTTFIGQGVIGNGYINCIDIGQNDNQLLVVFSNYGITNVWETTDGGTTWKAKDGNLPDMPVRWGIYNPNNRKQVMLATETGVWLTNDISSDNVVWESINNGMANVRTDMIKYRESDGLIVIATHGRGVYTSEVFATKSVANFKSNKEISYAGAPISFIDGSTKANNSWQWNFGDGNTSTEQNPSHVYQNAGIYTVSLAVNNGSDTFVKENLITVLKVVPTPFNTTDGGDFETHDSLLFSAHTIHGSGFERGNSIFEGKDGTHSGNFAYVTAPADTNYADHSIAYLYTPAFDFSANKAYTLEFYTKYNMELGWDGVIVEYSDDQGNTWHKLGKEKSSDWYNETVVLEQWQEYFLAGEAFFSGTTNGKFVKKNIDVTFLQGNAHVAFRILFKSDPLSEEAGIVIDDFAIIQAPPYTDAAVIACNGVIKNNGTNNDTIYNISQFLSLKLFKESVRMPLGASFEIYHNDGVTVAQDLQTKYKLLAKSQDNSKTITYLLIKNNAPLLSKTVDTIKVRENSSNDSIVYKIPATDADNNTLTYKITSGNQAGAFKLQNDQILVANKTLLDFEITKSFTLAIQISDGIDEVTQIIRIDITNVTGEVGIPQPLVKPIKLYPNPSAGVITMLISQHTVVRIYDNQGSTVFNGVYKSGASAFINLSHLPKGLYHVQTIEGDVIQTQKLVLY